MIGKSIGNYRVERLIGEGGMGKVYLAVHPAIGRRAAIKILAPADASDPQVVSRFITEARAANAIRHPNIVDIYDSGVLDSGIPYIVMEFLEGELLSRLLSRGILPIDQALDLGCQIAEALAAAHTYDVVHRDLKPDNLFLIADPRRLGRRQVKVLDFGIAKLQRHDLSQMHKTRTGSLLGTPLYMSPEQCMGLKDIDARTDIYSLGVILFEMVTGKRPFDSESIFPLISMHINDAPPSPRRLRPELPRDLELIILQALAKKPSDRQESMAHLLSCLELARGDTAASSDALARVRPASVKTISLPHVPGVPAPEIKTLGDTAVSNPVTVRSAEPKARSRTWLLALAAAMALLISAYAFRGNGTAPLARPVPKPVPAETSLPVPAMPAAAVPANPPPGPSDVEVMLDSDPSGAQVFVGDVLIGSTPGRVRVPVSAGPVDFVFRRPGFAAEHLRAVPSDGLVVRAVLSEAQSAHKGGPSPGKRRASRPAPVEEPADIKTER